MIFASNKGRSEMNQVQIIGNVYEVPVYSHSVLDENYYKLNVRVKMEYDIEDTIQVIASEKLFDMSIIGKTVLIEGEFHSNNVILFVCANKIEISHGCYENKVACFKNKVVLEGYVCKEPIHRYTHIGRELCTFVLSVERNDTRCDYIPCTAWANNAYYASSLKMYDFIHTEGEIQSRTYYKEGKLITIYYLCIVSMQKN